MMNFDQMPSSAPVTFEYMQQHPANFEFTTRSSKSEPMTLATCPCLSEEQIQDALENYISANCCYRDKFMRDMKIRDIMATPIYGYSVEFFIEKRTKEWVTEPYRGEYIAPGPVFGVPVDIWSVPIQPQCEFGNGKHQLTIPGSISVVNCAQCTGIGNIQCGNCAGSMTTTCSGCSGTGMQDLRDDTGESRRVSCIKCKGLKRTNCDNCKGKGTAVCKTCQGFRRVKNHEIMDVTWTTVTEISSDKKLGEVILPQARLNPLTKKLLAEVTSITPIDIPPYTVFRRVVDSNFTMQCSIPHQRVLSIRQKVFLYPASEVISNFKSRDTRFLVFGEELVVYFPQGYPTTCCSIV